MNIILSGSRKKLFSGMLIGFLIFSSCSKDKEEEDCPNVVSFIARVCVMDECAYTVEYGPFDGNQSTNTSIDTNEATYEFYKKAFDEIPELRLRCWEGEK